jgi:hypothetical protein
VTRAYLARVILSEEAALLSPRPRSGRAASQPMDLSAGFDFA